MQQARSTYTCRSGHYKAYLTAGYLGSLCEENYALLRMLIPTIRSLCGDFQLQSDQRPVLSVGVDWKGPYTQELHLTYKFQSTGLASEFSLPDAYLRLYHDARQLEVLKFGEQVFLDQSGGSKPSMLRQKWRANAFIGRWLRYSLLREGMLINS